MKIDQGLAGGLRSGRCATQKGEQREAPDLHCGRSWQRVFSRWPRQSSYLSAPRTPYTRRTMADNIDFGRRGFLALGFGLAAAGGLRVRAPAVGHGLAYAAS